MEAGYGCWNTWLKVTCAVGAESRKKFKSNVFLNTHLGCMNLEDMTPALQKEGGEGGRREGGRERERERENI
jgi:hypothetical protein